MAKKQGRKPPRRPAPKRIVIDDELVQLALAIDERRVDKNVAGWFKLPWRDGWNAIRLAVDVYFDHEYKHPSAESTIVAELGAWARERRCDAQTYWLASEYLAELGAGPYALARAVLRCFQVMIAKSDGGGEVFNAILAPALESYIPEDIEQIVENNRMCDAIGEPETMHPGPYERRKVAFQIAWRRGLYQAAYAV